MLHDFNQITNILINVSNQLTIKYSPFSSLEVVMPANLIYCFSDSPAIAPWGTHVSSILHALKILPENDPLFKNGYEDLFLIKEVW
jgi:hypothetical protein